MAYSNKYTNGNDYIMGSQGNDRLYGGGGNDSLYGFLGKDWIDGGDGNDFIVAGDGDVIIGGRGKDIMIDNGVNVWDRDTFVFNLGDTGTTTETADVIMRFTQFDRIDVPQIVVDGPHLGMVTTSIDSIEDAVSFARLSDKLNGSHHNTAYLFSNIGQETSYLVMDMDGNGSYESGVVMTNSYSTTSANAQGFLDAWLV
ncbi:calcium-binding protein [Methylobacterium sp. sgz302541]|uniref:calcium-binding protein n=1 Tax=unclassified Methylobacterium TaxID=2615210 RepID=UPI003D33EF0D